VIDFRTKKVFMILGSVIGVVFLIIMVVIVYLCWQRARSEENKVRLTARMSGLDEIEVSLVLTGYKSGFIM